ncbi:MAG: imidazolonepropionase, partial [Rhodospirillales bacterium]|nr:imidazolonepropionase [Rhodospirillales bacterium]
MAQWQSLWINVNIATMTGGREAYGLQPTAALAVDDGKIAWLGPLADLPGRADDLAETVRDCDGQWMTPGLIDCHTHLVFGGNRVREFELRLKGASYEEISKAGGGIRSTVAATR